ncbi:MAG: trigger factor [Lachnospiraceae bacterium]|nr:trigger factor [Lachnospiraceae bacterium]
MSLKNLEKLDGNMAKLTVEVSVEDFEKAVQEAYLKNRSRINVPGFRKGKAPRNVIEKLYGKGIFYEDAANAVIPDAYEKAVDESKEDIVSSPKIDVEQLEDGKPFVFTAEVALKPPVTLGTYKGVKVEKFDTEVTDEDLENELKREQEQNAREIEVTDRAVQDGDRTVIDFEGFVDGVAFDGGKGTDHPLTIGSGSFIPGFEEALIGAEIGKELDVNVTFPEDYHEKSLAGKPAVFKCTVKSIKVNELPELNDEFASDVSEFDTLDEYKESLKKRVADRKEAAAKEAKEDAVIAAIIDEAKMDIPEAMIETQQRQLVDEFATQMRSQGLTMDQYMQYTGLSQTRLLDQVRPQAENRIKSRLVLEAVAKAENITVSDEDLENEYKTMGEVYQLEASKVKEMLGEAGEKNVREDILVKKALEFVTENAKEEKAKKSTKKAADEAGEETGEEKPKKTAAKKATAKKTKEDKKEEE